MVAVSCSTSRPRCTRSTRRSRRGSSSRRTSKTPDGRNSEEQSASGNLVPKILDALKDQIKEREARSAALRAGAHKMESRTGGDAAIELAKSMPRLRLKLDQLDAQPTWLNTPSGTLDLDTMEIHPHRFSDLLTKIAGVPYNPNAMCPRWDSFLEEVVPDIEVRAFLQRSLGLALTDITREQCLWFLYGLGRNGKTTLPNAVRHVLGDYAAATKASTLMVKQHGDEKRNDVAVLRGARFVSATEAEDGQKMAEALIKEITGEDPVTARLLYAEFFTFRPTFKVFLAANHKPIISGVDLAIWRRIHLVPFEQTIPEPKVDGRLPLVLQAEGSGILNWLVAGYRAYIKSGLQVPQAVKAATAAYRHESDPLADFLEEACVVEEGLQCPAGSLFEAYQRWVQVNGIRFPLTAKRLGQLLTERSFKAHRGTGGVRFWRGLSPRLSSAPQILRLYRRLHTGSSLAFLNELRRAFPFPIRHLQCDNGQEFSFAFALAVEAAGIRHRYIRPRRPQQNGKVERSHRIDHDEFWGRHQFADFEAATAGLRQWETRYNYERLSLALKGRTPAEKLAAVLPPAAA